MNDTLKMVIALLISTVIITVLINFNNSNRIDIVGFFEDLWKKIQGTCK